jgi:hypothetical protein
LIKISDHYDEQLIGHIKGSGYYPGSENVKIVVQDTWEYIMYLFTKKEPVRIKTSFNLWLKKQADEILKRHKIKRIALRAAKGDDIAFKILKAEFGQKLRDFFLNRNIQSELDLDALENATWVEVFEKMRSPEKNRSYNPPRGTFEAWIAVWANFQALRFHEETSKRLKREKSEALMGSEEEPINIDNLQPSEDGIIEPFSRIQDPAIHFDEFENRRLMKRCYLELLCMVFNSGAKPHQLISFVYQKLLEWKPRQIVDLLSSKTLWDSGVRGYEKYAANFSEKEDGISAGSLDDSFSPLFIQLNQFFEKIYTETEYEPLRKIFSGLQTGLTKLEIYFGTDKPKSISQWTFKLKERVRKKASTELNPFHSS